MMKYDLNHSDAEYTIKEISGEEYLSKLETQLKDKGLMDAVESYADVINDVCQGMHYVQHRLIQECLADILILCEMAEKRGD